MSISLYQPKKKVDRMNINETRQRKPSSETKLIEDLIQIRFKEPVISCVEENPPYFEECEMGKCKTMRTSTDRN
jgi:hypothetical protein